MTGQRYGNIPEQALPCVLIMMYFRWAVFIMERGVFVKLYGKSETCSNSVMARKCGIRSDVLAPDGQLLCCCFLEKKT